jgi:RNA polymerase sigma factor (sigma-70 family)
MDEAKPKAGRDRKLVDNVLAGRTNAFAGLVEQHQQLVWHLVYRMVQHPDDCQELCQEVFLRVHQNLKQFRFESTLATWIGRIAYNICVRHLQRKRLPLLDTDEHGTPPADRVVDDFDLAAACADKELLAKLHIALEMLAPVPRTILTLYYLEELSVSEVASIIDSPEGTVKNALFRARAQLRQKFETYLETSDDKA